MEYQVMAHLRFMRLLMEVLLYHKKALFFQKKHVHQLLFLVKYK